MDKSISFVSLNCYLIPGWLVNKDNYTCVKQDERAKNIGEFVKHFDIIALQEMWGSQVDEIQKRLESHNILSFSRSWTIFGHGSTLVSSALYYWRSNGGLWFASRKWMDHLMEAKCTFTDSVTKSKKGSQVVLLDLHQRFPNHLLLVFNIHLDPLSQRDSEEIQYRQLVQFKRFIEETIEDIERKNLAFDATKLAILICGDFNFGMNNPNYSKLQNLFGRGNLRELKGEVNSKEEFTYDPSENSLAIWEPDRIDFVFGLDALVSSNLKETKRFTKIHPTLFEVVKQPKGQELSDHWPQIMHFVI